MQNDFDLSEKCRMFVVLIILKGEQARRTAGIFYAFKYTVSQPPCGVLMYPQPFR